MDARPNYVRFLCPDGGSTFSLYQGEAIGNGTTIYFECDDLDVVFEKLRAAGIEFSHPPRDEPWLWRQAELLDPAGNQLTLYYAGDNRINPPWRIGRE